MSEGLSPQQDKLAGNIGKQRKSSGEAVAAALQNELAARATGTKLSVTERMAAGLARKMHNRNEKNAARHFSDNEDAYRAQALQEAAADGKQVDQLQPGERPPAATRPPHENPAAVHTDREAAGLKPETSGVPDLADAVSGIAGFEETARELGIDPTTLKDKQGRADNAAAAREVIAHETAHNADQAAARPDLPGLKYEADLDPNTRALADNMRDSSDWQNIQYRDEPAEVQHIEAGPNQVAYGVMNGNIIHHGSNGETTITPGPAVQVRNLIGPAGPTEVSVGDWYHGNADAAGDGDRADANHLVTRRNMNRAEMSMDLGDGSARLEKPVRERGGFLRRIFGRNHQVSAHTLPSC